MSKLKLRDYEINPPTVGRPRRFTKKFTEEIYKKFDDYLENYKGLVSISDFCLKNKIARKQIQERPVFSALIEKCKEKRREQLIQGGLSENYNPSVAIFCLKVMGEREGISPYQEKMISLKNQELQMKLRAVEKLEGLDNADFSNKELDELISEIKNSLGND